MKLDQKRWLVLLAGILINLCQGAAYASSVFAKPMLQHLHCTDPSKWVLGFSINLACLPVGMLLSGKQTDRNKGQLMIVAGGILFGSGMLLASFANSWLWLYLTFGVMMGTGSGAAYGAVVSTAVRWFPERRGFASGLAVGALGFGSFLIPGIAIKLMNAAPAHLDGVLYAFRVLGIAFLTIISTMSIIVAPPPADYKPEGYNPKASGVKSQSKNDFDWSHMLGQPRFWLLFSAYVCGTFAGLMFISQASPIAQSMAVDIKVLGDKKLMAAAAAVIVSTAGLSNALGRVLWGFVSDRIGRIQSVALMTLFSGIAMFLLPKFALESGTLKIAAVVIAACYGGCLGTFPSLCADSFGTKNLTINYGLLFSATSVASITGPIVAAKISGATGSYGTAFVVAGVVSMTAVVLSLFALAGSKKKVQTAA